MEKEVLDFFVKSGIFEIYADKIYDWSKHTNSNVRKSLPIKKILDELLIQYEEKSGVLQEISHSDGLRGVYSFLRAEFLKKAHDNIISARINYGRVIMLESYQKERTEYVKNIVEKFEKYLKNSGFFDLLEMKKQNEKMHGLIAGIVEDLARTRKTVEDFYSE